MDNYEKEKADPNSDLKAFIRDIIVKLTASQAILDDLMKAGKDIEFFQRGKADFESVKSKVSLDKGLSWKSKGGKQDLEIVKPAEPPKIVDESKPKPGIFRRFISAWFTNPWGTNRSDDVKFLRSDEGLR